MRIWQSECAGGALSLPERRSCEGGFWRLDSFGAGFGRRAPRKRCDGGAAERRRPISRTKWWEITWSVLSGNPRKQKTRTSFTPALSANSATRQLGLRGNRESPAPPRHRPRYRHPRHAKACRPEKKQEANQGHRQKWNPKGNSSAKDIFLRAHLAGLHSG